MILSRRFQISLWVAVISWLLWMRIGLLGPKSAFYYVEQHWPITLTMMFGSMVAGATSEGGGAVAFPVFTKLLHVTPWDAKLFSLAIQSIGMAAASIVIMLMRVKVEWWVIGWASLGGAAGMSVGATGLAPLLPPDVTKMTFTAMTSSFAVVLYILNRGEHCCHDQMPTNGKFERNLLIALGFAGGILASVVGTGLDIVIFSTLVLLFRVSEKVATPTSVILMAINSIVGVVVYFVFLGQMNEVVFSYWMAAFPVVVIGASLGAILCAYMSRLMIAKFLIGLISLELISSLLIIPLRTSVVWYSLLVTIMCLSLYFMMLRTQRYEMSSMSGPV